MKRYTAEPVEGWTRIAKRLWPGLLMAAVLAGTGAPSAPAPEGMAQQRIQQAQFDALPPVLNIESMAPRRAAGLQTFREPVTAAKIRRSIEAAVQFLKANQTADGSISGNDGYTALGALATLAAGGSPTTDDSLRRALDWLLVQQPDNTYVRGIRANVWEYALRKVPYDEKIKAALKDDYDWLIKALGQKEGWRYSMTSTDWDNSVTQYGVLGIWAAARAGIEPGDEFWRRMFKHFRDVQNEDGGWGYQKSGSTPNMATAGLATLFLVFDKYHGKGCYTREKPDVFTSGEAADCLKTIARGMDWLGKQGGSNQDGYYLYGIERAGVAGGRKYIGGQDWFAQGVLAALRVQNPDGSFSLGGHGGPLGSAAFAALFMVYGGAPTAYNKLEYGEGQDWNLNPRDLANVARDLWAAYERPLNWASVSITAPASEFEAPVLFISGSRELAFKEAEAATLKAYVEAGGTLLLEASDRSTAFAGSIERFLRQMFPEKDYPAYRLESLPDDHPVFTVIKQDWKDRPKLRGVSDGSRTFFLVSDGYLSADWQRDRTETDAFKFAMNLLFYATDNVELEGRFATHIPDTEPAAARQATLAVARVRHGGGTQSPMDWAAGPGAWQRLAPYCKHLTGASLAEKPAVRLGADKLDGIQFLHITGRHALQLTREETEALQGFVKGGGTLLIDAFGGAQAFAESARRQLAATFGKLSPLDSESMLGSGRFAAGADLSRGIGYTLAARRELRRQDRSAKCQHLEVAMEGTRPAVIFSAADVTAALAGVHIYGGVGYKPASAFRIMGNVFALAAAD
jgi:hypothetical protein